MKTATVLSASVLFLALTAGCAAERRSEGGTLPVARDPVITDIPVPQSFKIDLKRSYYSTGGATRVALLVYTGRAGGVELLAFFRDNMPVSGWTLVKESADFGSYIMDFQKGPEEVQVRITPGRLGSDVAISLHRQKRD